MGVKEAELKSLYDVEIAASDLAALLEAQRAKKDAFEIDAKASRDTLEAEIQEGRVLWVKEQQSTKAQRAQEAEDWKKECQRKKELFNYDFERESQQQRDGLGDELSALKKQIAEEREVHDRAVANSKREYVSFPFSSSREHEGVRPQNP